MVTPRRIVLLLVILGCSEFRDAREAGEAAGKMIAGSFELAMDITFGTPTLQVLPGTPDYYSRLETEGPQNHYYSATLDATTIVGDSRLENARIRWFLATYAGRPPAGSFGDLEVHPPPGCLVVTVRDTCGEPLEGVDVEFEFETSDGSVGTISSTNADGEVRFVEPSGQWRVRRNNAFLWWDWQWHTVDIPEHRIVHAVLDGDGLRVLSPSAQD